MRLGSCSDQSLAPSHQSLPATISIMWLARPVYEFLPYLYMLVGLCLLAAAWFIDMSALPSVFLVVGVLSIMAGLVLWLRRRDYRTRQAEYDNRSLED
jgi:hypothetical protein